ncbi:BRO family protein [Kitasatospora sp. NPDC002551]|uniref:phage antirepressor n=1 Tax=Kitasatospora sp. NPDC002551 TaxID=3154539 RepID=UPI00332AA7D3
MSIIPYTFPETATAVRVVTIDGEPWFVAADVTTVLGYANGRDALSRLPERMKGSVVISDGTPGNPNRAVVSESGVYRLVMRSNLPAAERFQDWISEEVLPSIRRSGSYSVAPVAPMLPDMATPEGRRAVAAALLAAADREIELNTRVAELEPKALAHDTYLAAREGDVLIRQAAKLLGWRERDLRQFLVDEHLVFRRQAVCGAAVWDFYAQFDQHFTAKETVVTHTWGDCAHYTLHVTPRGMELVQKRIAKRQAEMDCAIAGGAR